MGYTILGKVDTLEEFERLRNKNKHVKLNFRRTKTMKTEEWLKEIIKLVTDAEPDNMEELLFKLALVAAELGYEVEFW